jgi:hypothetical protein
MGIDIYIGVRRYEGCDTCEEFIPVEELRYQCLSPYMQPDTLSCVMWGCAKCFPDGKTADEWADYFEPNEETGESEASRNGHMWIIGVPI